LFDRFGSAVVEQTSGLTEAGVHAVAVFDVNEPDPVSVVAFTLMVMMTSPPTLIDPRLQVTVVVEAVYMQVP